MTLRLHDQADIRTSPDGLVTNESGRHFPFCINATHSRLKSSEPRSAAAASKAAPAWFPAKAQQNSRFSAASAKIQGMTDFLRKLWELARPYRVRLFLGVFTGILAGLMAPLMIVTITFVASVVFPSPNESSLEKQWSWLPAFAAQWLQDARAAMDNGLHQHPGAVIALVAVIPLVMFLRGLVTYLNVYFLQWTAVRAVTDLRTKLFAHLINLSAGFFSQNRSGELISRIMSDTEALQNIFSNATSVIVRDPVTLVSVLALLLCRPETRSMTLISLVVLPVCIIPLSDFQQKSPPLQRGIAETNRQPRPGHDRSLHRPPGRQGLQPRGRRHR